MNIKLNTKFEGSSNDLLEIISYNKPIYLNKKKGNKTYKVIWLDYDGKKDDKWFIQIVDLKTNEGYIITKKDLQFHLQFQYVDFDIYIN